MKHSKHISFSLAMLILVCMLISGCGGGVSNQQVLQSQQNGFIAPQGMPNQQLAQQLQGGFTQPVGNSNTQPQAQQQTRTSINHQQGQRSMNANGITFTRFSEPTQGAFSVEVPQGWSTTGRTVNNKHEVQTFSPDNLVGIQAGDVSLSSFMEPSATTPPIGQCHYYLGQCIQVEPFMNGVQFATEYLKQDLAEAGSCQHLTFSNQRQRPDWEQMVAQALQVDAYRQMGMQMQVSAGEVDFICQTQGLPVHGRYLAVTTLTRMSDNMGTSLSMWEPYMIMGYAAVPERLNEAQAVLARMESTFQLNSNWTTAYNNASQQGFQQRQQAINQSNAYTNNAIISTGENYNATMDDLSRQRSNTMRGTTDVVNPYTGQTWNVESGSESYWYDPVYGNTYGSNTYESPDAWYEPLNQY